MSELKLAIDKFDEVRYSSILTNEIFDMDEVFMLIYTSVVCFNSEKGFDVMIKRNKYFKNKPEWNTLFQTPRIYPIL
jgi:ABC-type enterochelin transport system permease subunit